VLVAEAEPIVIGYVCAGIEDVDYVSLRGPAGVIYDLVLDEAYRRRGVGSLLLDAALAALATRGASLTVLQKRKERRGAKPLYEAWISANDSPFRPAASSGTWRRWGPGWLPADQPPLPARNLPTSGSGDRALSRAGWGSSSGIEGGMSTGTRFLPATQASMI
jgi:Acetyltransferase (GNAT) family